MAEPICTDWKSCLAFDGQQVSIVGTYTVTHPLAGRKGGEHITRVRIIPDGGRRGAYLEPYWSPESKRSAEELAALAGKRVTATGTLHLTAPKNPGNPENGAEMGGACLHPVVSITLTP